MNDGSWCPSDGWGRIAITLKSRTSRKLNGIAVRGFHPCKKREDGAPAVAVNLKIPKISHKLPTVVIARGIILILIAGLVAEVLFCRWLATRKWSPASSHVTIVAAIADLVGPICAVLPYTDYLPSSMLPDLAAVWLLAATGAIGIGIGVFAFTKGSKIAGAICVVTNLPVFAFWGFIGGFFGMGGSR